LPVSARMPWNSSLFKACEVCRIRALDWWLGAVATAGYNTCWLKMLTLRADTTGIPLVREAVKNRQPLAIAV